MKPLNKYLKGIFGNLGINDDIGADRAKEFVQRYNTLIQKTRPTMGCKYVGRNVVEFGYWLVINSDTDDLLEDGHLPDFICFEFSHQVGSKMVAIESDKFTSCKNFPHVSDLELHIRKSTRNIDFSDLKDCNLVIQIEEGSSINNLSSVRVPIRDLKIHNDNAKSILSNTKGIVFKDTGDYLNAAKLDVTSSSVKSSDFVKFFKNNRFEKHNGKNFSIVLSIDTPNIDSFDFIDEVPCDFYSLYLNNTAKGKKFDPEKYDAFFRNAERIITKRISTNNSPVFCKDACKYSKTYKYPTGCRPLVFCNTD